MQQPSAQAQTPSFRQVDSGHGVQWWSTAWQLLFNRGATAVWIVMWLIAFVIYALLHIFHVLGALLANIGMFVFAGGMMLAARKTDQQAGPAVGDLFAGFKAPLGSLVIGGVLLTVVSLLVAGAAYVAGITTVIAAFYAMLAGNLALLAGLGLTSLLLALVALLLFVPILMAAWMAPALIVFRQQAPVEALKASLAACWANLGALTVYGILGLGFAIVATILFLLGWIILSPLIVLTAYAMYCDLFESQQAPAP